MGLATAHPYPQHASLCGYPIGFPAQREDVGTVQGGADHRGLTESCSVISCKINSGAEVSAEALGWCCGGSEGAGR